MINIIKDKKINGMLLIVLFYLSLCLANWFSYRGDLGYYQTVYGMEILYSHDLFAFLCAGFYPIIFIELFAHLVFRTCSLKLKINIIDLKYALRFFLIFANIVIFALKFTYWISPFVMVYGDVLLQFIFYTAAIALFIYFCCKCYVKKYNYGTFIASIGGSYLAIYGLITVMAMLY